jgi:hypothetical protein
VLHDEKRGRRPHLQSMSWTTGNVATEDEQRTEEETTEEGPRNENGLEGDDGSRSAEGGRNGGMKAFVVPLSYDQTRQSRKKKKRKECKKRGKLTHPRSRETPELQA